MTGIFFLIGLLLGSFINALVYRYAYNAAIDDNGGKSAHKSDIKLSIINGRSLCPKCKETLSWRELIPVFSWLVQRGKCRHCADPISLQYPIVELVTALVFVVSYMLWPYNLNSLLDYSLLVLWLMSSVGFVSLSVYDAKYQLLPNSMVLSVTLLAIIAMIVQAALFGGAVVLESVYAGAVFFSFFYLLYRISDGAWIGGGDVKLAFALGLWIGSIFAVAVALFLSSVLGLLFVVLHALFTKKTVQARTKVPFGPMLIIAMAIVFLAQDFIVVGFLSDVMIKELML